VPIAPETYRKRNRSFTCGRFIDLDRWRS
jgi:hypothetical protein